MSVIVLDEHDLHSVLKEVSNLVRKISMCTDGAQMKMRVFSSE